MEVEEAPATNLCVDDQQIHAIVRSWVFRALQQDESERYRQLLADLKSADFNDPVSMLSLSIRLRALSDCVSYIKENHEVLQDHLLYMSFWNCTPEVSDALEDLVVNMASSSGLMVPKCLDMLVRNFLPPSCGLKVYLDCYTEASLARKRMTIDELKGQYPRHMTKKAEVLDRVHQAIQRIVQLVPIASTRLERAVQHRMPHKVVDKEWTALYLESMLRLDAKRIICTRMLDATVDRLIEIDVEIEWEAILRDEPIFSMDTGDYEEDLTNTIDASGPGSEAQLEHVPSRYKNRRLGFTADKMDVLMDLTLEHIRAAAVAGRIDELYKTLLASFRSTVLTTYKSKFTQFLMFYICSLSPTCAANFAGYLWDIFQSVSLPKPTRMSAAAYLASYLARARFLPLETVSSIVNKLVSWCASYAPSKFSGFQFVDVSLYGVFYSACQAAMYVLCFRLRDLHEDATQRSSLKHLRLKRLIDHKLSPLLVCLPSVVEEFLKQATAAQLISASETPGISSSETSKVYGGANRLDMFFPFDPYLLRESSRFIKPVFTDWSMVRPLYEGGDAEADQSEEDEYSSDEEPVVEDEEEQDEDALMEEDEDHNAFRNSLECMSITPPTPRMLPAMLSMA